MDLVQDLEWKVSKMEKQVIKIYEKSLLRE